MSKGKSKGYILLEILAVVLIVLLWLILTKPPKIWEQENQFDEKCKTNMSSLYEAQNYFYKANGKYAENFDSLFAFIENDEFIQHTKKVVDLSNNLNKNIENVIEIPAIKELYNVNAAINEIMADFVANQHYLANDDSSFLVIAENISSELQKIYIPADHPGLSQTFVFIDSLSYLLKNITDYKLQIASQKALLFADSIKSGYEDFTTNQFKIAIAPALKQLYAFYEKLKVAPLAERTNIPDRLKKFTDQINRTSSEYDKYKRNEQIASLQSQLAQLKKLHELFLDHEHFQLTSNYAELSFDEITKQIAIIDPSFAKCPDNNQTYIYNIGAAGSIIIECPNLQSKAKELLLPPLKKIQNFEIWNAVTNLIKANDSLLSIAEENKNLLRKHRDYFMLFKDIQSDFIFFNNKILTVKYLKNIKSMVEKLDTNLIISDAETLFSENLLGFDTLAKRCELKSFPQIDNWEKIMTKKVMKIDTLSKTLKLKQREKRRLKEVLPVLEYWKIQVATFRKSFKSQYISDLLNTRQVLKSEFDKVKNGLDESQQVIFYQEHKNHGNVDNGIRSWEK